MATSIMKHEAERTARKMKLIKTPVFVRPSSGQARIDLVEYLEAKGFTCVEDEIFNREDIINSGLPLVIDHKNKTIRRMGNITCAAAAVSSGVLTDENDVYKYFAAKD